MEMVCVTSWQYKFNKIEEQEEGFSYKCSVFFKIRALRIICAIAYLAVPEMNLKTRKNYWFI